VAFSLALFLLLSDRRGARLKPRPNPNRYRRRTALELRRAEAHEVAEDLCAERTVRSSVILGRDPFALVRRRSANGPSCAGRARTRVRFPPPPSLLANPVAFGVGVEAQNHSPPAAARTELLDDPRLRRYPYF
jgi:hypothetical protein